jgi:acylglycerol lipase
VSAQHVEFNFNNSSGRTIFATKQIPSSTSKHAVIILHGLGEHLGRYRSWARLFTENNAAVYCFDMHGHGKTTGKRGHTESFHLLYDDIETMIHQVKTDLPEAHIHLYGHSMGGCVALGATLFRNLKITSLVTTGPAIRPGFEPPKWKVELGKSLDRILPSLTLSNELDVDGLSYQESVIKDYRNDALVHSRISVRWYNDWIRCVEQLFVQAKQMKTPTLIVHGQDDTLTSPKASEELANALGPIAEYKLWTKCRHELHHEIAREKVFQFIWTWMQRKAITT